MDFYTKEEMRMHISRLVKLVEIHRQSYESVVNGEILVDHFVSLQHGLRLIGLFFDITKNENLIVGILKVFSHVKQKLYFLSHLRKDESLVTKLDREYSHLREEMLKVIIKAGTNKYHSIFPGRSRCYFQKKTSLLLCEIIEKLVSSDCKARQMRPVMNELVDIRKMLSLLEPFFEYEHALWDNPFAEHEKEIKILSTVDAVMERVTCFVYLSVVGKMDDQMVNSLRMISSGLIIEETQIMDMYLSLDVDCTELESHISMSLRLLEWNKRCYLGTELGEALEDHFTSIEHGLQYIVKILKVSKNEDLNLRVKHLIVNMKQKLYSLPHSQNNENMKVSLEQAYGELREEMKMSLGIIFESDLESDFEEKMVDRSNDAKEIYNLILNKSSISTAIKRTDDVKMIYYLIKNKLSEGDNSDDSDIKELYLLKNLMILLQSNGESSDDENSKLRKVLGDFHSFLLALPPNVILRKLNLLKESFEDILCHSIPIVYSCYLELTEVETSAEFNCVLDLINHIKSEALEMKLYYFPRVDDLGFLEFLLGYLEDLKKNQEILLKKEIDALHIEVRSLLSLANSRNQEELDNKPWNDIMNLAYQAEYIIDLYLVSSPRDLGLISSLSKIIQQLLYLRTNVTWDFSHLFESLPAQEVAAETSEPQVISITTKVKENDKIVGLQEEIKNVMGDLLECENKLNVVSISGMAGVGKTTLALTLYNNPSIEHHFGVRAFCVVSQSNQLRALLVSLLDQVNPSYKSQILDDEELADQFYKSLKKRRYLIILDDVWDTMLWNYLKRYLPDDKNGSRILITTREGEVADQIKSKVNVLHGLSDKNSWELFQKKMLQTERLPVNLQAISKGIVRDCKGLPLSIVIVAGILSDKEKTEEKWNQIAISVSSVVHGNCKGILELSYKNLPYHLRSCFLYLGSFTEDQEISVNRLILLWIGEGFIQDTKIGTAEEIAKKYIEDLILKNLVIPAKIRSGGGVKTFRLHDLLRDFCLDKAKENHFFTLLSGVVLDERNHSLALQDPRRIIMSLSGRTRKIVDFSCHSVRSMICQGKLDPSEIKKRIGSCDMVLLRVLEIGGALSEHFPMDDVWGFPLEDISSLVHLRYLAIHWGPQIKQDSVFTSSISKLQNLQILILKLSHLIVPDFIWDMVKLRHIHILQASFEVESNRLQKSSVLLENLKSLSRARVSYGDSKWLSRLLGLQRLHCVFSKFSFTNKAKEVVDDVNDNQSRMLSFNKTLISLKVENSTWLPQRFKSTCQLPQSLRKLTLTYFYLESDDISAIGQTLTDLEVFKIYSCGVPFGYEWNVEDENFPKLKVLKLKDVKISKWIVSEDSFPKLEQIWVEKCDCLEEIPIEFGYLSMLHIISVEECPPSVDNSAREIEKVQHEQQNTEMRVHISQKFIPMYVES